MDSPEGSQQGPAHVPFEAYARAQAATEQAQQEASYDKDTGILKGSALEGVIDGRIEELEQTVRDPQESTLGAIVADMDGFKQLNTAIGHPETTQLLGEFAQLLQHSFRTDEDVVGIMARIGGDELFVMLELKPRELVDMPPQQQVQTAVERTRPVIDGFFRNHPNEKVRQLYERHEIGVSLGCSVWEPGWDTKRLVQEADGNMYENKGMHHAERNRRRWESLTDEQRATITRSVHDLRQAGLSELASGLDFGQEI